MSSDPVISLRNAGKFFELYKQPRDRLWQILWRGKKKFYEEYWACADINLDIYPGECFGILGRNGAGKSTLLQLISGILAPSHGTVVTKGRIGALLELGSGFNPEFTGRENVLMNAAILGLSSQEIAEKYDDIVKFADIGPYMDRPVKTYSSGMALRLAFAVMANVNADILVIDEALAVGDAWFTQKCMRFLREFMKNHTVVLVSHDLNAITSLCIRAAIMENGRLIHQGPPREIAQKYLETLYEQEQTIESINPESHITKNTKATGPGRDMRRDLLLESNLRNDLQVFAFNCSEKGFGTGKAAIAQVWLADPTGQSYAWIVGGEVVQLHILAAIHEDIKEPIVGFMVVDSHGQELFGDNTWLTHPPATMPLKKGEMLETIFTFQMPILAPGDYHITAALGEGTPEKHIQHHWLHEAVTFTAEASPLATGLVGVPMLDLEMIRKGPEDI